MFDTIVLLTGPVEEAALTAVLQRHNPRLDICSAKSLAELEAVPPATLARARLIGFVTPVVVPTRILAVLGFGAYNFHPGPPHYPGWVPAHCAAYDRAERFGATVHIMIDRVDAGPIVAAELFPVPPSTGVLKLQELAFAELARLFWRLAPELATQSEPLPTLPVTWSGRKSTQRIYAGMCEIAPDISKDELEHRIEVFGAGHFGIPLTVSLHGHRFSYVAPQPSDPPGMPAADKQMAGEPPRPSPTQTQHLTLT